MEDSVVIIIGTRPAAIKAIPVYFALKALKIHVKIVAIYQQKDLLLQVLELFEVVPDVEINIMKKNQDLFDITELIIKKLK